MSDFPYQIGVMGNYKPHLPRLTETIKRRFDELGMSKSDFKIVEPTAIRTREKRAPFAAIYFGAHGFQSSDDLLCEDIIQDSLVILPVVDDLENFSLQVPKSITGINGLLRDVTDLDLNREVSVLLEGFRLLRSDRRLFISYKRSDARSIAQQLYEEFDRRGFDVFLDINGVPPGKDFQSTLWHRLADSDVVILLDTPHFFESRWTTEEIARANSTNVQILHLLWPGRPSIATSALSTFVHLDNKMFDGVSVGDSASLLPNTISKISIKTEEIRARALSQRQRYLVDAFCDQARVKGFSVSVQPDRSMTLQTAKKRISVVPIIGVSSSTRLHEVHESNAILFDECWALFDERGLLKEALRHFEWLNSGLPIKTIPAINVVRQLDVETSP